MPAIHTYDAGPLDDQPPRISWRLTFMLFVLATVLRFAYFYLDDLTRQMSGTLVRRLLEEGTGNFASAILFPIAVLLERRYPVDRGRWRRHWFVHVVGYIVYSVAHTTVIALTRAVVFPAAGQGTYDYGVMSVRYFMEAAQDFFSYAAFVAVLTLMRVQQHLRAREVRSAELERDAANARLEILSLRLQPHFLFNALNTISSTVYDDPVAADDMIGRLGDLLRQALQTGDRPEIRVDEELEMLRAYLTFVEARFGDRLRCELHVDDSTNGLAIPAFLLQPLVENAVRHGALAESGNTEILISVSQQAGRLTIVVENDIDEAAPPMSRIGTGLGTSRDRLRLLYGASATLTAGAETGRFRVQVDLPAHVPAAKQSSPPAEIHAGAHR
jgi:two-component system, LytTR family, sensor kinase